MSLLLPVLVAIPPVLAFVFETPLLEQLHALVQPRNDGSLHPIGRWARRTNLSATARLDRLLGTKSLDGSLTEDSYFSQTRDSRRSSGDLDVARNTLHRAGSSGRAGFSGVSRATDPSSMGTQSVDTPVQEPATDAPHSVNDETSMRMEEEIELELKQLRGQRGGASSPSAIVRRGQTTKQFMDDSKRAAKGGLGV